MKTELLKMISSRLIDVNEAIDDYGDRDTLVENAVGGGNHNDTFEIGETFGWYLGQATALKGILEFLEESKDVEHQTN